MAIDGGGGGGGLLGVSNSFTGPATALEIAGDFAYAYSGVIQDAGSGSAATTLLSFTSGNYLFVGELNYIDGEQGGTNRFIDVTFNGTSVFKGSWDDAPKQNANPLTSLIIPPYTEVEVKFGLGTTESASTILTGRIYK